ncbi:MAG: type II toxin-antitoxin system prevent-host-death family antitoxin [Kiritimatiellae bacterium]|jgi:prevent-host-death family protein|nr:type II toxin-antitoxin system prevent-host-death family antitoxin [Kiritimatiellia bacterium]
MNAITLSVTDVARNFSEYVNRVNYKGDRFVLVKGGREVAELKPVPKGRLLSELAALLKTSARLSQEEAEAFEADINEARAGMNKEEIRDSWDF